MVCSDFSDQRGYTTDSGNTSDNYFTAKPVSEQISECENVINKVHFVLKYLNIPVSRYETELNDLKFTVSNSSDSLKRTRLSNINLTDQISRVTLKSEERRMWIQKLKLELSRSRDDFIYL